MLQLSLLQYAFALGVLAYASICDLKTREVSNRVWVLAYPAGFALTLAAVATDALNMETVILSVGVSLVLGFVLLYFGFYGGADAKALIFVALTVPAYPTAFNTLLGDTALPPVLTIFCNSVLLSMICPLTVLALNFRDILKGKKLFEGIKASTGERVLLLFTTRKIRLDKLGKDLTYLPAETVEDHDGKLTRKPFHFIKAEEDISPYIATLQKNRDLYMDGVLASPTIPFIVFFVLAVVLLPLGNPVL